MQKEIKTYLQGYRSFREKYAVANGAAESVMHNLAVQGQKPKIMVISCCDSRVDPSIILQVHPGEIFVVRNIANIVPPLVENCYSETAAALQFGICALEVEHLIIIGHSQCGGIKAFLNQKTPVKKDFISLWVSTLEGQDLPYNDVDQCAQKALFISHKNCLTYPWIKDKVDKKQLIIHKWFFDIEHGLLHFFCDKEKKYIPLY